MTRERFQQVLEQYSATAIKEWCAYIYSPTPNVLTSPNYKKTKRMQRKILAEWDRLSKTEQGKEGTP
jgi:hypothetical protein